MKDTILRSSFLFFRLYFLFAISLVEIKIYAHQPDTDQGLSTHAEWTLYLDSPFYKSGLYESLLTRNAALVVIRSIIFIFISICIPLILHVFLSSFTSIFSSWLFYLLLLTGFLRLWRRPLSSILLPKLCEKSSMDMLWNTLWNTCKSLSILVSEFFLGYVSSRICGGICEGKKRKKILHFNVFSHVMQKNHVSFLFPPQFFFYK